MLFKTKFFRNVNKIFSILKKKILIAQNSFSLALFSLFLGFLCGNLFGTFLDTLRIYFLWNGFVVFIILLFIETINFFVYRIPLVEKINTNLSISQVQNSSSLLGKRWGERSVWGLCINGVVEGLRSSWSALLRKSNGLSKPLRRFATFLLDPFKKINALQSKRGNVQLDFRFDKRKQQYPIGIGVGEGTIICIEKSLNAFKIGLLFGFFIDSFKVGS